MQCSVSSPAMVVPDHREHVLEVSSSLPGGTLRKRLLVCGPTSNTVPNMMKDGGLIYVQDSNKTRSHVHEAVSQAAWKAAVGDSLDDL